MRVTEWATAALAAGLVAAGCGARASLLVGQASETGTGGTSGTISTSGATGTGGGSPPPPLGACKPGDAPVVLVSGETSPGAIAVDASGVYFTTEEPAGCSGAAPRVRRVDKAGGTPAVVGHAENPLLALAVDAQNLYWSDNPVSPCTTPDDTGYTIFAAPKGGGAPLAFPPVGEFVPAQDVALDASFVYWIVQKGGAVYRAAKSGDKGTAVFTGSIYALGVALDDTEVYWTSDLGVMRTPKLEIAAPVVVVPLAPGDGNDAIAVDSGDVYFTGSTPCNGSPCWGVGLVEKVSAGGGAVTKLAVTQDQQPHRLALGPTYVYWAAVDLAPGAHTGAVLRAPRSGGPPEVIAKGKQPTGIAVDESCVYWTDLLDGSVWRAPL